LKSFHVTGFILNGTALKLVTCHPYEPPKRNIMHELSIAQSILSIAENAAPKDHKVHITSVAVQIGELSGIEIESLKFALSVIKRDTLLRDAELDIEVIEGQAECPNCSTIFPMHYFGCNCPNCGNYFIKVMWEVIATPITYRLVAFLKRAEHEDYYDTDTDFNPFVLNA